MVIGVGLISEVNVNRGCMFHLTHQARKPKEKGRSSNTYSVSFELCIEIPGHTGMKKDHVYFTDILEDNISA